MARTREKIDFLRKIGENTKPFRYGAGEGNRTLVTTLEKLRSTIELHPQFIYYTKHYKTTQY